MKYQASAVRVVWIVWKKRPATMYWIEICFIVSQTDSNQSRTSKPARWQSARTTAIPRSQRAILTSRLERERSWNGVTVRTVWWKALIGARLSRWEDGC